MPQLGPEAPSPREIHVSALVMQNSRGEVLNVRKRGTEMLMLPGGKPEPGEQADQAAMREFHEELGVMLHPAELRYLGEFRAAAANEAGFTVVAQVFTHPFVAGTQPCAEIEHLEWVDPLASRNDMAPLNSQQVFPALFDNAAALGDSADAEVNKVVAPAPERDRLER